MTSFLQSKPAAGYKPHHIEAMKRREARPVPEQQEKLSTLLETRFGQTITKLEPHAWEYGLTVGVSAEAALQFFKTLKEDSKFAFNLLVDVTAVDWLDRSEARFELVYQLLSLSNLWRLCVKIPLDEDNPEADSVRGIWPAANFLEREVWDMFGIRFRGHGDLRRVLMYEEFVGHPLRKDYPLRGKQPRIAMRIPELRNTSDDLQRGELVAMPTKRRPSGEDGPSHAMEGADGMGKAGAAG